MVRCKDDQEVDTIICLFVYLLLGNKQKNPQENKSLYYYEFYYMYYYYAKIHQLRLQLRQWAFIYCSI